MKHGGTAKIRGGQGMHGHGFKKGVTGPTKGGASYLSGGSRKKYRTGAQASDLK